ncbi:WD40 repeat-like protein [Lepidopterella palustris CBS 459.81]|uniref:WD40 repeat-like protein n=1 Tax=Lepidopterella palustris CBS 459.81 TaxID=1314670 RepID=A0A8E2EDS9_9PEZI|nr:WD40 repeat-like protein [Lepidopterella palustris CBS 459.81]
MGLLKQIASSDLSLPPNSYIYKIIPTAQRYDSISYSETKELALISSDDSLRFVDASSLELSADGIFKEVNKSVTCLDRVDDQGNCYATCGRDGLVRVWDKRRKTQAMVFRSPQTLPLSALVCSSSRNVVVAGVELEGNGPGDAPVVVWDFRNAVSTRMQFVESHTDTITDLQFHPTEPNLLLSGSTDGLVNVFDISKPEEEDALYQVINHRSAVHHAGFLNQSTDIYALGTDETLSFYALQSPDESAQEPQPNHYGDVREKFGCEYVAKLSWIDTKAFLAVGSHSSQYLDLIPLEQPFGWVNQPDGSKKPEEIPLNWRYDLSGSIRLPGGHGEEIVRDIYSDGHSHTTFTCGEDGYLRAWKFADTDAMEIAPDPLEEIIERGVLEHKKGSKNHSSSKEKKKGESKGVSKSKKKERFKPY